MILTRYTMHGFELGEELFGIESQPLPGLLQALTDPFARIGTGGDIEQAPIGLRILQDGRGFAFHSKHHRAFALFDLLQEFARTAAESAAGYR